MIKIFSNCVVLLSNKFSPMKFCILFSILLSIFFLFSCKSINKETINSKKELNYIPYYLKVYEADSLFIVGNYKQSYNVLDSLFTQYEPLNMSVYSEYETYIANMVQLNSTQKIRDKIEKTFSKYGSQIQYFRQDSLLNKALVLSKFSDDEIEKFSKIYQNSLDLELRAEVEEILEKDQRYRVGVHKNFDSLGPVDIVNTKKVKFIFENKGYPGRNKIGDRSFNGSDVDLTKFFLHTDWGILTEYFLPLILKYVKSGECYPPVYATPLDKVLLYSGEEKQKYGTFYKSSSEIEPVLDLKALDSLRKSIGLPHINYSAWRLKAKYGVSFD